EWWGSVGGVRAGDSEGKARLACPPRPGERDQPTLPQQRTNRVAVMLPADKAVEARRKVALHPGRRRGHGRVVTPAHRDRRKRRETLQVQLPPPPQDLAA